jgi:hypothetical protein
MAKIYPTSKNLFLHFLVIFTIQPASATAGQSLIMTRQVSSPSKLQLKPFCAIFVH